jgi:hypothetical protein
MAMFNNVEDYKQKRVLSHRAKKMVSDELTPMK